MSVVVIGGGIVGCHISYLLAKEGFDVFLLEKEKALGEHTSTRNSGVIHSGIYYPKDSLKARLCLRGRHLTYEFLDKHNIPYRKCGKIIVALIDSELKKLEELKRQGEENGVENLRLLSKGEVQKIEPRVRCLGGLYSPESGILDMGAYIRVMEKILIASGVKVVKQCMVTSIDDSNILSTTRGEMMADLIINSAGLYSDTISKICGLDGYEILPCKGDYYITTEKVVKGLVYPVPDSPHSLGIHLTPTFGGEILIGPSTIWISEKNDYTIRTKREEFERGALSMVSDFDINRIYPGYSGNRPKLYHRGKLKTDFVIEEQEGRRIHLLGIESPGLTAAPAIAENVAMIVR